MKLTDKVPSAVHRVLVFGPPKTGKTELVSKLASKYHLIWFDLENGYITLTKLPKESQANIELISIPDTNTFPIAVQTLKDIFKTGNECFICEEHGKVTCPLCKKENKPETRVCLNELTANDILVIDSLTQFTTSCISSIEKAHTEGYKFEFDEWRQLRGMVISLLSKIQQVKTYNVVCITHEEEVEFDDGRKKIVPVCGSQKSSRDTAKYFDHVVYCDIKNKKHGAASSTTYSNNVLTGSRTDVLLEGMITPDLFAIFDSKNIAAGQQLTQGQKAITQLKEMTKS